MSNRARARMLGATLAAMTLAGMTTVARAEDQPTSTQDARRPPTEAQVGESWRHRQIDRQATAGQPDDQGKAQEPSQAPSAQDPRRYFPPEPPMDTGPRLDTDQQVPPDPAPSAPADSRTGLVVALAIGALLLAVGAAAVRSLRPPPERPA